MCNDANASLAAFASHSTALVMPKQRPTHEQQAARPTLQNVQCLRKSTCYLYAAKVMLQVQPEIHWPPSSSMCFGIDTDSVLRGFLHECGGHHAAHLLILI